MFSVDGKGKLLYIRRLSSAWLPKNISVRFNVLSCFVMAMGVLTVACLPTPEDTDAPFTEKDAESWRTSEIVLLDSETSDTQGRRIFSAKLPLGWEIRHARLRGNSWSGQLVGYEFTLDFQGGLVAVSLLDDIVGRGSAQLNEDKAAAYLVTEEEAGESAYRTMIRPQEGGSGVIGMIMDLEGTQLLITGREMTEEQQNIAFAVFRRITP